jgi:hypothetical protein
MRPFKAWADKAKTKLSIQGDLTEVVAPNEDPHATVGAEIVLPAEREVVDGLATLKKCLPHWLANPALLVIKPNLGLVVSVVNSTYDQMGFSLSLGVEEKLIAPRSFDSSEIQVGCGWNQPYMNFDESEIWASYCFSLHFGAEGVSAARAFSKDRNALTGVMLPALRGRCQRANRRSRLFEELGICREDMSGWMPGRRPGAAGR